MNSIPSPTLKLCTSLEEIRSFNPCASGWKNILKGQGKVTADAVEFPLVDCLKSNSIGDVCWLLGKRKNEISICVRFANLCAEYAKEKAVGAPAARAGAHCAACWVTSYAADVEIKQLMIQAITEFEDNISSN